MQRKMRDNRLYLRSFHVSTYCINMNQIHSPNEHPIITQKCIFSTCLLNYLLWTTSRMSTLCDDFQFNHWMHVLICILHTFTRRDYHTSRIMFDIWNPTKAAKIVRGTILSVSYYNHDWFCRLYLIFSLFLFFLPVGANDFRRDDSFPPLSLGESTSRNDNCYKECSNQWVCST